MHLLLGLLSMAPVLIGSSVALAAARRVTNWSARRDLQLLVLAAPLVGLTLELLGLHHFAAESCFLEAPPWDYTIGAALPLLMTSIALAALALGFVRLLLMTRLVARRGSPASGDLEEMAGRLAERLGVRRSRLVLCCSPRPLALTCGLWQPAILLSTWMVERLDRAELQAVLAHEFAHVARRDFLMVWLATVLRDGFFYLPTSHAAYRRLQAEKELACDDAAVQLTQRPLALASALAKVWHHGISRPLAHGAQPLAEDSARVAARIQRLLSPAPPAFVSQQAGPQRGALGLGALAMAALVAVEVLNVALLLAPMGCGPGWPGSLI